MRLEWAMIVAFLLAAILGILLFKPVVSLYTLGIQAGQVINAVKNIESRQVKVEKFLIDKFQPTPTDVADAAAKSGNSEISNK